MQSDIPAEVRPFLWSYDIDSLDLERDKKRIITNVLNFGTKEATDWLFRTYSPDDIRDAVSRPFHGEWDRKSLSFWSLIFGVSPGDVYRHVL